jgi:hypothetical protein
MRNCFNLLLALLAAAGYCPAAEDKTYVLTAKPAAIQPGGKTKLSLDDASITTLTSLDPRAGSGVTCDKDKWTCAAPAAPASGLAITGFVEIAAKFKDAAGKDFEAKTKLELTGESEDVDRGPWEARLVVGYHQAGAASSDFKQNVTMDFYVVRPLQRSKHVWLSRFNSWGSVRIASSPRQLNTPFVDLVAGLLNPTDTNNPLKTNVNELALAGEFDTGLEWNLTPGRKWNGKVHGLIAYFGAMGAFEPPEKSVRIFETPQAISPQWALFHERFPAAPASTAGATQYVAFVLPDRDRFYRRWGVGYRYSKYNPERASDSPQTYTVSVGGDEAITGGTFSGAVVHLDAFYPLPISKTNGRYNVLYVFATSALRLARGDNRAPVILKPAADTVKAYDANVTVVSQGSTRDYYRLGIGVDFVRLLGAIKK